MGDNWSLNLTMLRILLGLTLVAAALAACGTRQPKTVDWGYKIVGGQDADPGEYPWQASIQYKGWGGLSHYCGASLISDEWVLWAGHCSEVFDKSDVVILGEYSLSKDDGTEKTFKVAKKITHEKFNGNTFENDISLLHLESKAEFEPVCLPEDGYDFTGFATVTGWGTTSEGGNLADILQEVVVPIVDDKTCNKDYDPDYKIYDSMICAGEKGKDSCQGDSGGPMHCELEGKLYECGIVSFGRGCARDKFPGVYTEVSKFRS